MNPDADNSKFIRSSCVEIDKGNNQELSNMILLHVL